MSLNTIQIERMNGTPTTLADFNGRVCLVVNVASKCGLTPQYKALEATYRQYHKKGFEILAFPANNFGGQEPGTNDEITQFCKSNYDVTFPMFQKISVNGADRHALYNELTSLMPKATSPTGDEFEQRLAKYGVKRERPSDILWNFEKFLIGKDGKVIARFAPDVEPDSKIVKDAIEAALAA